MASASLPASSAKAAAALPQVERALLVFDAATGREDLVWGFEPRDASQASLQIVPVPSKPEVSLLGPDALDALVDRHPLFPSSGSVVPGLDTKRPTSAPSARAGLSWKTFTPTELEALRAHLEAQGHPADAATTHWLERLALRGFHFVAVMRPAKAADPGPVQGAAASASAAPRSAPTRAEPAPLLRLRFETPAPYFPYAEPAAPSDAGLGRGRVLSVWSISAEAQSPVAVYRDGEARHWVRPWRETANERVERKALVEALGAALGSSLPRSGDRWVVQRFLDQKSKRDGFGDVLLVPRAPAAEAPSDAGLARAVGLLDAELEVGR